MNSNNGGGSNSSSAIARAYASPERERWMQEDSFLDAIAFERKRAERSRRPFVLMLIETRDESPAGDEGATVLKKILKVLSRSVRETDSIGWYRNSAIVGLLFTDISNVNNNRVLETILGRVTPVLNGSLTLTQIDLLRISFHVFPEDLIHGGPSRPTNPVLYPDLQARAHQRKTATRLKRVIDVLGSTLGLILCSPLFLVIAIAIKMTSHGPVFFRQQRIGQLGVPFTFLKFRSMFVNNEETAHREYVTKLILGIADPHVSTKEARAVFKIAADPRVTRVGTFLRRTSLDELPQLWNVFRGDMSLVGPRPPIRYEVDNYDVWHRRRILESKPGMTGLWQVNGRCRIKFDEMVRLDLRYANTWSPWLDLKILLLTPRAVFLGEGAC